MRVADAIARRTSVRLLLPLLLLAAAAARAQPPLALQPLFDLPSPNGCAGETMTMRADALGRPFLYVAAKDAGLRIYDLAPAAPQLARTIPVGDLRSLDVMNLAQQGNQLFLALGDHFSPTAESPGLAVVDVSDPTAPRVLDVWHDPAKKGGAGVVTVEPGYAYLGAMGNGLVVFAVSPAGTLQLLSRLVPARNFPDRNNDPLKVNARGMAVRNHRVYLAYDAGGLRIVDVKTKTRPVEIGRWSNPALNGRPRAYNNVVVDGNRAYVTVDYCGLEVLDVKKPANVKLLSWWNPWRCPGGPLGWFTSGGHANELDFDPQCKLLFLSGGKSDLEVLSVADPKRPQLRRDYPGTDNGIGTWGVARAGDRVYLSYICTLGIPFASNWSGVKAFAYDRSCAASSVTTGVGANALHAP